MSNCPWEITISPRVLLEKINFRICARKKLIEKPWDGSELPRDYIIKNEGAIEALEDFKSEIFNTYSISDHEFGEKLLAEKAKETMQVLRDADLFKQIKENQDKEGSLVEALSDVIDYAVGNKHKESLEEKQT